MFLTVHSTDNPVALLEKFFVGVCVQKSPRLVYKEHDYWIVHRESDISGDVICVNGNKNANELVENWNNQVNSFSVAN